MKHIILKVRTFVLLLGILNVLAFTSCKDEVAEMTVPVTGVTLNLSEFKIQEGVEYQLNPIITPENATNKEVEWSVGELSVEGCVEIDAKTGNIKPIKPGTAVITVKTIDGNFTASCNIEIVKEKIPVESITIDAAYSIVIGESYEFTPIITPVAPSNSELHWSLDNVNPAGCLTIDENTGKITAVAKGTATVNVEAADGRGAKASCEVTILEHHVYPTGITLSQSVVEIEKGNEPVVLQATILPETATIRNITWEVVDANPVGCVTVDNGAVTGVEVGTAKVRATITDSRITDEISAECVVTIIGPTPEEGFEIVNGVWFIYNLDGLKKFREEVSAVPSVDAKLIKDIDLGTETWEPIGSDAKAYSGKFDGNGKKISNLNIITDGEYKGFFAKIDGAAISNLGIESGEIDASQYLGGIAGYSINSTIINCYNKAKVAPFTKYGGGITGYCEDSYIIACYNAGEMARSKVSTTPAGPSLGGLAGEVKKASYIIACYNCGSITQTKGPNQGGIAGILDSSTKLYGVYNVGITKKTGDSWAISGGTNVSSVLDGVYWTKDIEGTNTSKANKASETQTIEIPTAEGMNTQEVVDGMNQAIQNSGVEAALEYEFKVGTGDYKFPVITKK